MNIGSEAAVRVKVGFHPISVEQQSWKFEIFCGVVLAPLAEHSVQQLSRSVTKSTIHCGLSGFRSLQLQKTLVLMFILLL